MTAYVTKWGADEVRVSANWAEASCPIEGLSGQQVADFAHRPTRAMRRALVDMAKADGLPANSETAAMIRAALDAMREEAATKGEG